MAIRLYPKPNAINETISSLTQAGIKDIDHHIVTIPKPIISMEAINNNPAKIILIIFI